MTVTEFTFLALGLLLGVAAGAALVEVLRARPPAPREVRITVARDAVPRRSATLADDGFLLAPAEPAHGGPADRRSGAAAWPSGRPDRRTPVLGTPGWGVQRGRRDAVDIGTEGVGEGPRRLLRSASRPVVGPTALLARVPVSGGTDPMLAELRAAGLGRAVADHAGVLAPQPTRPTRSTGTALLERPVGVAVALAEPEPAIEGAPASQASTAAGPCADARRVAEERCELASRARAGAVAAEDALRAAQRAYDDHESRAEAAARIADPREVRAAKDAAQAIFRAARDHAGRTEDVEAAARAWLGEINRINTDAREATAAVAREREAARTAALRLERLAVEADAARIGAETADAACLAARSAVADCEELAAADPRGRRSFDAPVPGILAGAATEDPVAAPMGVLMVDGTPRIFRLLRGDRSAMTELVAAMAGDDPDERRRWQLAVSDLVDAILADAIAASVVQVPSEHPFWSLFTLSQSREIVAALSSLGYRFDGLGGWVDGRIPSQRDLSLAVGYAGLDPMRIRHWPNEAEMTTLFEEVTVAADEHLASVAGDLTLGEMVAMLGKRADGLAEVWNHWGPLRPLLLEER